MHSLISMAPTYQGDNGTCNRKSICHSCVLFVIHEQISLSQQLFGYYTLILANGRGANYYSILNFKVYFKYEVNCRNGINESIKQ